MFISRKDPLIIGVDVLKGVLKIGTPLCLFDQTVYLLNLPLPINNFFHRYFKENENWSC